MTSALTSLEQRGAVRVWPPTPRKPATAHKNGEKCKVVFLKIKVHAFRFELPLDEGLMYY